MANGDSSPESMLGSAKEFRTTHWSVVLAAGRNDSPQSSAALETLCRTYWYPLYAFVRRQGHGPEEAQDLTQEFFARFLAKNYLSLANPERGRFRSFLLSSLRNFLINDWRRVSRPKRGGGQRPIALDAEEAEQRYALEPADEASPDKLYEKRWATTLLEQVMSRLGAEFCVSGRQRHFEELKEFIWGDRQQASQSEVAARLGMSEGAIHVAVHRLRKRYRDLLREEIANTVTDVREVDEELRFLKMTLSE